jgi:hypothetical protein
MTHELSRTERAIDKLVRDEARHWIEDKGCRQCLEDFARFMLLKWARMMNLEVTSGEADTS